MLTDRVETDHELTPRCSVSPYSWLHVTKCRSRRAAALHASLLACSAPWRAPSNCRKTSGSELAALEVVHLCAQLLHPPLRGDDLGAITAQPRNAE